MVPKPVGDVLQRQPLTTALRNCCRDYPAGGGVLRELLQNADDAGATFARFHLDEKAHPTDELIHVALADYQGEALLAYNNAIFTEKDFESLRRLGDSLELQDSSTTGKFGRGSILWVYNWTDSPSIVSLNHLLILDPHEEFSTGGDLYDFVADADDHAIQNHMAAFQSVMKDPTEPFQGTIIRIPLRSKAQTTKSDICKREATVSEIREVLDKFATEFGDSGLLFLRNIEKITIDSTSGISISIEVEDVGGIIAKHKSTINNALKAADKDPGFTFDHSFEMKILRKSSQEWKETSFLVHHMICARSDFLSGVPWVAVAAQFPYHENFKGSLFTVLPLPISIHQPVHVHGLFNLSPDRARLYQVKEDSTQDQSDAKWNEWLLHNPIPMAWTNLLGLMAGLYPNTSTFEWWPRSTENDILSHTLPEVLDILVETATPVWSTAVGHVTILDGLLGANDMPAPLREALKEAQVPVVYLPERLKSRAAPLFKGRILDPRKLYFFLMDHSQVKDLTLSAKRAILEYLLSDPNFTGYDNLELFPFKDGNYRAIAKHTAFVHRNEAEMNLFNLDNDHNLDLDMIPDHALKILRMSKAGTLHPSIPQRSGHDFKEYCLKFHFPETSAEHDIVSLNTQAAAFVLQAWPWILEYSREISATMFDLWLLPLTNGQYRKVKPRHQSSEVIFAPLGSVGDLMRALDARCTSSNKRILDTSPSGLSIQAKERLLVASRKNSNLLIRNGGDVIDFVQWLHRLQDIVKSASDAEKDDLIRAVVLNLPRPLSAAAIAGIRNAIGNLDIFKKVSWKMTDSNAYPGLEWTSIEASEHSINLYGGIIPVPVVSNIQFLHTVWQSDCSKLLNDLGLANGLSTSKVIETHIIPNWSSSQNASLPHSCRVQLAKLVFNNYSSLSLTSRAKLRSLQIVPVAQLDGGHTSKLSTAPDLVDPSSELKRLFFDTEEVVPESTFYIDFKTSLIDTGLKCELDETLVINRVRYFAKGTHSVPEIQQRVQTMFKLPCKWNTSQSSCGETELCQWKWLPVSKDNILSLRSPTECRCKADQLLAGSQMIIFGTWVSREWQVRLGWDSLLPKQVLLRQLEHGTQHKCPDERRKVIDRVLIYIVEKGQAEHYMTELTTVPCIPTSNGRYTTISEVFRPQQMGGSNCDCLHPYLGNVEFKFWLDHRSLLTKFDIQKHPSPQDVLSVQKILESRLPLNEPDLEVAKQVLNIASRFTRDELSGLKILTDEGTFCPIEDVSYNDLGILASPQTANLAHPIITSEIADRLQVERLSEKLMKGMLEIDDFDEDDKFEQHEQITTRILDSLNRYPVSNTFKEYLANADDTTGTSVVNWLLDERTHADNFLVTPELKSSQGTSLLVHNDVFSDTDLAGFKDVGRGSKQDNKGTIGQFGRGSQTMYHFTDTPMILTGSSLIILDPQQRVLPRSRIGKRKSGVILPLAKLKTACPDQLSPFEGLWGYNRDLDCYDGTIFRFPLRTKNSKSKLRTRETDLDAKMVRQMLAAYFDEARLSLLFLKRITTLNFKITGSDDCEWSIHKGETDSSAFSQLIKCSITQSIASGIDKWRVAIEDLQPAADELPYSPRRVMKNVECGIAGLVSSDFATDVKPCFFNTLPLPLSSDLPVCIHASFSLSGDRQSLIIETESSHSKWNRWLLQTALPELYLKFLDDVGRDVRDLRLWPQEDPPKRSSSEALAFSFWKLLPESSGRFFPKAQMIGAFPASRLRQAPVQFELQEAIFDFLERSRSELLNPLLLSSNVKLAQQVPYFIAKHLKALKLPEERKVHRVDGEMLCDLLKYAKNGEKLQIEWAKNDKIMEPLLAMILPFDDLEALHGCYIVPLADGTIAPLRLRSSSVIHSNYYYASETERDLFDFASPLLISSVAGNKFEKVIKSGKFNIENLGVHHIGKLLALRSVPSVVDETTDKWLIKFWHYWDEVSKASSEADKYDFPGVFRARFQNADHYSSLSKLNSIPAVVYPNIAKHQLLCSNFSGLWRYDSQFMPKNLRHKESDFKDRASFFRYIKSLKALSLRDGESLGESIKKHLSDNQLKVLYYESVIWVIDGKTDEFKQTLRKLLAYHTFHASEHEKQVLDKMKVDLRSIPMWPSVNATATELIPAENALTTKTPAFLVPWMRDYGLFIDPEVTSSLHSPSCIQLLDIPTVSTFTLLGQYLIPIPPMASKNWPYYQDFISAVSSFAENPGSVSDVRSALSNAKVAMDANGSLRKPNELYNHGEPIFASAFRGQEGSKFLHAGVQSCVKFWLKLGLRSAQNRVLNGSDYLQCLNQFSQRFSPGACASLDVELSTDTDTVLSPLITHSSLAQGFGRDDWRKIANEKVFPARAEFWGEVEHRQARMGSVGTQNPVMKLAEIVTYTEDHVAVCWSQSPFPRHAPTPEALSFVKGKGNPSVEIVWKHLSYLADMAQNLRTHQVNGFLHDLNRTYLYLSERAESSTTQFNLRTKAVWLNVNLTEGQAACLADLQASSWNEIGDLVLWSSCDAGRIKAVRPSLMRYENLLRAVGCKSITYPTIARPTLKQSSTMASLRKLRDNKVQLDITFCTEGREIQAHRAVIAAVSEKFAGQWSGRFPIEDRITTEESDTFLSYHTISTIVDFAYESEIDWSVMQASENDNVDEREEKLQLLLDLLQGADYWIIPALKSQVEDKILVADRLFINIENVVATRERTGDARAETLKKVCEQFILQNQDAIDRASGLVN